MLKTNNLYESKKLTHFLKHQNAYKTENRTDREIFNLKLQLIHSHFLYNIRL